MFYKCLNAVKITTLYNKKGFIIEKNKNNIDFLKVLLKINIIKFIKINNDKIYVHINYIDNKPVFKNITNLFKPGYKLYISLKNLKKLSFKYNSIMVLSTSKGILTNFEAIKNNVGGLLIMKVWN